MQLFTSDKARLDIKTNDESNQDTCLQSSLQSEFLKISNIVKDASLGQNRVVLCCIIARCQSTKFVKTAHIFFYCHGQEIMDAIFDHEEKEVPKLFSAHNGVFMNSKTEKFLIKACLSLSRKSQTSLCKQNWLYGMSQTLRDILYVQSTKLIHL